MTDQMKAAVQQAKAAWADDTDDAAYNACVAVCEAAGVEPLPDCTCADDSWYGDEHATSCPITAWLQEEVADE